MKKGFTLAETLITLTLIAVLATITLPIIKRYSPNKPHLLFRKVYYTASNIISELVNDYEIYPEIAGGVGYLANTETIPYQGGNYGGDTKFCELFLSRLNTIEENPDASGKVCVARTFSNGTVSDGQFTTADGVIWILPITTFTTTTGGESPVTSASTGVISVDINGTEGPNCTESEACTSPDRFNLTLHHNGKLVVNGETAKYYLKTDSVLR